MKFYSEFGNEQRITENLEWNCTCKQGSVGRFRRKPRPCICIINAMLKYCKEVIENRKYSKNKTR